MAEIPNREFVYRYCYDPKEPYWHFTKRTELFDVSKIGPLNWRFNGSNVKLQITMEIIINLNQPQWRGRAAIVADFKTLHIFLDDVQVAVIDTNNEEVIIYRLLGYEWAWDYQMALVSMDELLYLVSQSLSVIPRRHWQDIFQFLSVKIGDIIREYDDYFNGAEHLCALPQKFIDWFIRKHPMLCIPSVNIRSAKELNKALALVVRGHIVPGAFKYMTR